MMHVPLGTSKLWIRFSLIVSVILTSVLVETIAPSYEQHSSNQFFFLIMRITAITFTCFRPGLFTFK
jgi:hypothetical protein